MNIGEFKEDMFIFDYKSFKFIFDKNGFTRLESEKVLSMVSAINNGFGDDIMLSDVFLYEWANEVFISEGSTSKYLALNLMYNAASTTEYAKIKAVDYIVGVS